MTNAHLDFAALDALFAPFDRTDAPGFAVGVALPGRPPYRRGFGMASVELPVALSPTIRMRIGSTSKHFCALAVMLLVEQGRLSLDDSPRRHLSELPEWAERITLRQLMAHTSGMRDSLDLLLVSAGPGAAAPADLQRRLLAGIDSVNFAPGDDWNYNNGGYVLLSEIVARTSGEPFPDFLRTRIFDPIGMHDTLVRPLDTDLLPNSATLHVPRPDGGWSRGIFGPPILGEGGIVSTADDMLKWLRHMGDPVVGSRASWAEMRTPLTTHGYGLGLRMDEHRGLATVHHAGGVIGGSSQMIKILEPELDIILMTNGRSAIDLYELVDRIIDACIPGLPPAPEDFGGAPIHGTFYSADSGRVLRLSAQGDQQLVELGGMALPVRRDTQGWLQVPILPSDLRIMPVGAGDEVTAVETTEFGKRDRLTRIEPAAGAELADHLGTFEAPGAMLTARIEGSPEQPIMTLAGPTGSTVYRLVPLGPSLWQAVSDSPMALGGSIELDRDGFRLTTGRTVRLAFGRAA
jgi:CubicO group peptidase (beta-lactamase class C family)